MLRVLRNEAGERKPPPLRAKEKEGTIGHIYPRVTKVLGLGALLLVLTAGIAAAALPQWYTPCYLPNSDPNKRPVCDGTPETDWIVGLNDNNTPDKPEDDSDPGLSQKFYGKEKLDQLEGKRGNDTINGNGGGDWLYGGFDDDTVNGGGGNDHLIDRAGKYPIESGLPDSDRLNGGDGDDEFYIADGDDDDVVNCGPGADKVVEKDPGDTIAADCEQETTVSNAVAKKE